MKRQKQHFKKRPRIITAFCAVFLLIPTANAQETSGGFSGGSVIVGYDSRSCDSTLEGAMRYFDGTGCSNIGDLCPDGSYYAGLSPDGNIRMYVTSAAHEGTDSWNDGVAWFTQTSQTSTTTGASNTTTLLTTDSNSNAGGTQPHDAAAYCDGLSAHTHTDWYLPAKDELNLLWNSGSPIAGVTAFFYWSSTEGTDSFCVSNSYSCAWEQRFDNGTQNQFGSKDNPNSVRCVRKDAATGTPALQYCNGTSWINTGSGSGTCDTTPVNFTTAGIHAYGFSSACTSLTIEAFGAGGGYGRGGGGGGSVVLDGTTLLVAGGGGGGGGNNDSGGGGGYGTDSVTTASISASALTIVVGGGGECTNGDGGDFLGTAYVSTGDSTDVTAGDSTYGGGGGANTDSSGNATAGDSTYGGGGGAHTSGSGNRHGGDSTYGGGGGATGSGGSYGSSTNGNNGTANGGGGGGHFPAAGGTIGSDGNNATGGTAANSGPGDGAGSSCTTFASDGRVTITPVP